MMNDYSGTVGPSNVLSGRVYESCRITGQLQSRGSVSGRTLEMLIGMSAYEIAVKYGGFVGTEEEWISSLKGDEVLLRNNENVIQWKYKSEAENRWKDLIQLSTIDYNNLFNKPLINGVALRGNQDLADTFVMEDELIPITYTDIDNILDRLKGGG